MTQSPNTLTHVKFPIKFTTIVSLIVLVLTGIYWFLKRDIADSFVFFSAASAAAGIVITAFYTAEMLSLTLTQAGEMKDKEGLLRQLQKKERALEFGARWNDPRMHYVREACGVVHEQRGQTAAAIIAFGDQNRTNVVAVLNFLEEIAFAIEYDIADREILKEQFSGIVTSVFQILGPWVGQIRTSRARPKIWKSLETLANGWH